MSPLSVENITQNCLKLDMSRFKQYFIALLRDGIHRVSCEI